MDSLLCGWASEGVGEAVGRPVDPCWDDEGNDVDAGPQRVEPDEAPTVVVEESDVAALAEEMRKLSEDAIAMKEQMRLLELERLEAHLEAERAARAEDAAAMDEDEPAAPATVAGALAPPAPEDDEAADAPPAAYAPAESCNFAGHGLVEGIFARLDFPVIRATVRRTLEVIRRRRSSPAPHAPPQRRPVARDAPRTPRSHTHLAHPLQASPWRRWRSPRPRARGPWPRPRAPPPSRTCRS